MMGTVIVTGAGASGLMAAIAAARQGAAVTVLEHSKKPGRKLSVTGNGRCNLTNTDPGLPASYLSMGEGDVRPFVQTVIQRFDPDMTLDFFETLGLSCIARDGLVYPRCGQASRVLRVLLDELRRLGVKLKYDEQVQEIGRSQKPGSGRWHVRTGSWTYTADALILCCGSPAAPDTGSDSSGYGLARQAGHHCTEIKPALTGLLSPVPGLGRCEGARTRARLRLYSCAVPAADEGLSDKGPVPGTLLGEESGEVQWTAYGLSGIAVFQLSRLLAHHKEEQAVLVLDHVPDRSAEEVCAAVKKVLMSRGRDFDAKDILSGWIHEKTAALLAEQIRLAGGLPGDPEQAAMLLARALKKWQLPVTGLRPLSAAQTTAGGLALDEFAPRTLESRVAPGLFAAGEILDVDGPCGGYNLQWAWSSGYVAGTCAAVASNL